MWGATYNFQKKGLMLSISIHAPVWGATRPFDQCYFRYSFQSTHPCGVRLNVKATTNASANFNPRTRVGCDLLGKPVFVLSDISIHAPVWGATCPLVTHWTRWEFQSTHPCGVRPELQVKAPKVANFNPRTRVGCDFKMAVLKQVKEISIHAPVWGATY